MGERVGPWIEHDGKGYPYKIVIREVEKGAFHMKIKVSGESGSRMLTPTQMASPGFHDPESPVWHWRWRGGIIQSRRRVCLDPEYNPCFKYRFTYREEGAEKSTQVEMLKAIAKGDRQPDAEPVSGEKVAND